MLRFHDLRTALVAALLLILVLPTSAAVRDVEVDVEPPFPTWRDEVTVTVRGESNCTVTVSGTDVNLQASAPTVRIALAETCATNLPDFSPFQATVNVGRLVLQSDWLIEVVDAATDRGLADTELTVYLQGDVQIALPDGPPTDDAPFSLALSQYRIGCGVLGIPSVDGNEILVPLIPNCSAPTGSLTLDQIEYEVGPLAAGEYRVSVFGDQTGEPVAVSRTLRVYDADGCVPSDTVLCLNDARFRVEVDWQDFQGGSGEGRAVPLENRDDTGLFWFFRESNVELTVKVLDGCGVNGHYWVFVSSGSTVGYEITVTDTSADQIRTYGNDLGDTPALISDTAAFASCP